MSHPVVTTVTLAAAVSNGIAASQALPGASGLNLVLNGSLVTGGVAVMDAARRVIITSAGNDSGIKFTITGTGRAMGAGNTIGPALVETITGANTAAAQSTQDFLTVTQITASGATADVVTAGTNGVASGPWVPWDRYAQDFKVSVVGRVLSGTPTYSVEYTYDDVFGTWLPPSTLFPRPLTLVDMTNDTGTVDSQFTSPISASRLTLSVVGSVELTQTQIGA
jgi:hypothetical protein